jgi:DNA polymerase (family 10)
MSTPLDRAQVIAEKIRAELAPFCDRIDVAGSVRRKRPFCNDVDLVLLVKDVCDGELRRRVISSPNSRVLKNGADIMSFILANGVQVDLFFAKHAENTLLEYVPGNYGMRLLAMTGSKEHNIFLARRAKAQGLHFHPYKGLMRGGSYHYKPEGGEEYKGGEVFRGEEELEIFRELGLGWIEPELREIEG